MHAELVLMWCNLFVFDLSECHCIHQKLFLFLNEFMQILDVPQIKSSVSAQTPGFSQVTHKQRWLKGYLAQNPQEGILWGKLSSIQFEADFKNNLSFYTWLSIKLSPVKLSSYWKGIVVCVHACVFMFQIYVQVSWVFCQLM